MDRLRALAAHRSRRRFLGAGLGLAGLGLLAGWGLKQRLARREAGVPLLGVLTLNVAPPGPVASWVLPLDPHAAAFLDGLRELGYVNGETIAIEVRGAGGVEERLPELAAELVRLDPDVLLVTGELEARAARAVTATVPIVFTGSADPIGAGLVASLAHPGGNVTGLSNISTPISGKRLELLQATVPGLTRLAVLGHAGTLPVTRNWDETRAAGEMLGLELQHVQVHSPDDFEDAFATMAAGRAEALVLLSDLILAFFAERIVRLAGQARLPALYPNRIYATAGGLMSYGPVSMDNWRRAATYVAKILNGASPTDLPVEQPTRFELMINQRTARAQGLDIPPSVLQQATDVIQ
jgi:putative ABC transport system substrate-binding protein